jgi:hypothetical protein
MRPPILAAVLLGTWGNRALNREEPRRKPCRFQGEAQFGYGVHHNGRRFLQRFLTFTDLGIEDRDWP